MFSYDWQQLHNKPIFCGWKRRENGSKLPMSAVTGKAAKVNEPNTFCTYRQAVNYCNTHSYIEGVGFRLAPIDENYAIWGIDVDCHDSEAGANPLQTEIFAMFRDTYAEYSPSGKGIHIIGLARRDKLPATPKEVKDFEARYYKKNSKLDVECYIDGVTDRYLTYTGRRVEGAAPAVTDMTDTLLLFLDRYMQRDKLAPAVAPVPTRPAPAAVVATPAPINIAERIEVARRSKKDGNKIYNLYDLGNPNGYQSPSEARLGLCRVLAFYLNKDRALIEEAFYQSALFLNADEDGKKKAIHDIKDCDLIGKAINGVKGEPYDPNYRGWGRPKKTNTRKESVPVPDKKELPPFVFVEYDNDGNVKSVEIIPIPLAQYIRDNEHFFYAKKGNGAEESFLRYVYLPDKGYYKLFSEAEFKGMIREHINKSGYGSNARMSIINEAFNQLTIDTDRSYPHDCLDTNEEIICFENGLLHLDTMELTPFTPDIISTVQIPVAWNAKPQPTPLFDEYMDTLTAGEDSEDKKRCLLEFLGVALSNVQAWRFKKSLFMVGKGDSGKSVFRRLMEMIVGRVNCSSGELKNLEERFGSAALYGKRLYGASDMSYATVGELSIFKQITGGDSINIEFKGKDTFPFIYRGVVVFTMNKMPLFGGDHGDHVYNRIVPIVLNNSIPAEKQDKKLAEKLFEEREGIVYKAVMALKEALNRGYRYTIPASATEELEKLKVDNSLYLQFIQECCEKRPDGDKYNGETVGKLHETAKEYCKLKNEKFRFNLNDFRLELEQRGYDLTTVKRNHGMRYYQSFRLTLEAKREYHIYDNVNDNYGGTVPPEVQAAISYPPVVMNGDDLADFEEII